MKKPFRHLILTRFNLQLPGYALSGAEWLEHRFEVFERFCLPAVRRQTNQNFDWIVFFHPGMPEPCLERIDKYARWSVFRPVYFRSTFSQAMVQAAISEFLDGFDYAITTRLDNDDAICRTFVDAIQGRFAHQDFEFLNFTNGYVWSQDQLFAVQHASNAFITLVERAAGCSTVYCGNHMELARTGSIVQLPEPPAWLHVVHGRNLLNHVWGAPCATGTLEEDFGIQSAASSQRSIR